MMNSHSFEIDIVTWFILACVLVTLVLQLLLCFRTGRTLYKLLPVVLFSVFTVVFSVCSACINGWDGLGWLFFALLSFALTLVCGIGWLIWFVIRHRKGRLQ